MKTRISNSGGDRETIYVCSELDRKYIPALVQRWKLRAELDERGDLCWCVDLCTEEIGTFLEWCKRTFGHKLIFDWHSDGPNTIEIYDGYRE